MTALPPQAGLVRSHAERVRRWTYLVLGFLCVGLGTAGVFLPGLPTTIFLILASYFFTRSCPWLEDRLIRTRFFGPYLRYLEGDVPMPRKAKVTAIAMMWIMIAISCTVLAWRGVPWWVPAIVAASGVVGTIAIVQFKGLKRRG
ncbi:MAG: membrane protein [Phycisphaerae bacterium]|nr:MAG: membrane protein [Phycisphaerae bacterium]